MIVIPACNASGRRFSLAVKSCNLRRPASPVERCMPELTIYHNPRCSKSREALALLQENGVSPEIVLYLDTPPGTAELRQLLARLGIPAIELVRRNEEEYRSAGLSTASSEAGIIAAIAAHPRLLQRPIVVRGDRAIIGRPPENVLDLLN